MDVRNIERDIEREKEGDRERKRERERLRTSQSLGDVTQALNIWQTVHMGLNIAQTQLISPYFTQIIAKNPTFHHKL